MLVRVDGCIPVIFQTGFAPCYQTCTTAVVDIGDSIRIFDQRCVIGGINVQRTEDVFSHVVIDVLLRHTLNQASHDARTEIGITVNSSGSLVVKIAGLFFIGGYQLPKRIADF